MQTKKLATLRPAFGVSFFNMLDLLVALFLIPLSVLQGGTYADSAQGEYIEIVGYIDEYRVTPDFFEFDHFNVVNYSESIETVLNCQVNEASLSGQVRIPYRWFENAWKNSDVHRQWVLHHSWPESIKSSSKNHPVSLFLQTDQSIASSECDQVITDIRLQLSPPYVIEDIRIDSIKTPRNNSVSIEQVRTIEFCDSWLASQHQVVLSFLSPHSVGSQPLSYSPETGCFAFDIDQLYSPNEISLFLLEVFSTDHDASKKLLASQELPFIWSGEETD